MTVVRRVAVSILSITFVIVNVPFLSFSSFPHFVGKFTSLRELACV